MKKSDKKHGEKLEEFYKAGKVSRDVVDKQYRQVKVVVKKEEIDNDLDSVLTIVLNYALSQINIPVSITVIENDASFEVVVEK